MQEQGLLYCFVLFLALSSSYSSSSTAAALSTDAPVLAYLNKPKDGSMVMEHVSYEVGWGVALMDDTEMGRRILAGADPTQISYGALQADRAAFQPDMPGNPYTRGSGGNPYYRS